MEKKPAATLPRQLGDFGHELSYSEHCGIQGLHQREKFKSQIAMVVPFSSVL